MSSVGERFDLPPDPPPRDQPRLRFHPDPTTASCPFFSGGVGGAALQECSSVGRASVSKTEGRGFESLSPCQFSTKVLDIASREACIKHALKRICQPNEHIMTADAEHFDIGVTIKKCVIERRG